MHQLARTLGFLPLLLYGWCGTTLTHPVPVHTVIGRPIEVPKAEDPSQADIDKYLNQFILAIERLFETYKHQAGYSNVTLRIL